MSLEVALADDHPAGQPRVKIRAIDAAVDAATDALPCDALDCIVDDINGLVLRLRQPR